MEPLLSKDTVIIVLIKMDCPKKNRLPRAFGFLIILALALSMFSIFTDVKESFSEKDGSINISVVNSSFIPLSNTDANQVKVNVEYDLENKKMQNQLVNAIMEVYAANGTLIRTTSIASGFTLQTGGGEHVLRTTLHDKSLQKVSIRVVFTDLSKEIPLSNTITDNLQLKEGSDDSLKVLVTKIKP